MLNKKVKLILEDGATLTVPKGIKIENNPTKELRIYQQSGGTGTLIAGGSCGSGNAGIGGSNGFASGSIYIHGGNVTAFGGNNTRSFDTISIRGGTTTAKGGTSGAGIGSGANGIEGDIQIYGGEVYASGTDTGAGIGGGLNASGSFYAVVFGCGIYFQKKINK